MALVSPGVEVNVIDESFYTPAAPGTVPMIFVASAENKLNAGGTGVAEGTTKANAGRPFLLTSQKDLGDLFGDPTFYSDSNGNMIHGGELNEYGLQTAYSLLGVTNQVFVVRADIDLGKLQPSANAPGGEPADGAYWFDTQNTRFGLLEWNAAPVTTTGGQSFSTVNTIVITETSDLADPTSTQSAPSGAVGAIGEYAIDTTNTQNRVWYKNRSGSWVEVGSDEWKRSWPAVTSTVANPTVTSGFIIEINGTDVSIANGTTISQIASQINFDMNGAGVTAAHNTDTNTLELFVDSTATGGELIIADGGGSENALTVLGLTAGTYRAPSLAIAPHTNVPEFKSTDTSPAPTGSIWLKTTEPNGGANFNIKQYSEDTQLWSQISAPIYASNAAALAALDASGGGENLQVGEIYVRVNVDGDSPAIANYKIYRRVTAGATTVSSAKVIAGSTTAATSQTFTIAESVKGSATLASPRTVTFDTTGTIADATAVAEAINGAGFTNIQAGIDSQNRITISHRLGGDFVIDDVDGKLSDLGFTPFDPTDGSTTINLYDNASSTWTATLWKTLEYVASDDEPLTLTADGELWYNSIIDEVDIMIHDGFDWRGYRNVLPDTDPNGPLVTASRPTAQSTGNSLADGDLWIDTSDLENFPTVYRYNGTLSEWVVLDKTDQTTENGILFDDARWSDAGSNSAAADIVELLESDYLDPDAPDPALYPKGMILWNLRRSGFNVKRFVRNYINTAQDNVRYTVDNSGNFDANGDDESMDGYYPHRWVTDSSNQLDGSGTFGRLAQRKSVVQALQSEVNSNQEIRDDERRFFNVMACPGYPELIGELITLNYDRKLTAFIVGDTPFRLTSDATSLNDWATNVNLAAEDNDNGLVSRDEYLGIYYPSGFTSDNAGNNVVVPASHMALRTIVLNDQVAYPWFAPAGTRRGGVTNASATGYISDEGEFVSIALNAGQRDVLYSNNINPITPITGAGLVVFGQKTRARNASALDRINVARLTVYLRRQLEILARPYLFEPNDAATRSQVKAAADALLLELVGLRAVYDFITVCDESNNTPARIDRNELYLDVAIEPVKAIEFIYIPLRIKNTGEIAALG